MASAPASGHAIVELRLTLDALADALRTADVVRLGALEQQLGAVVAAFAREPHPEKADATLAPEILAARDALHRCRRLGSAIEEVTTAALAAAGILTGYDRGGRAGAPDARFCRVQARV